MSGVRMRPNPAVNAGARRLGFARATVAGYLRSLGVIGHVRAEDAKLRQLIAAFLVVPSLSIAATPGITADAALQIVNGCVAHAKGKGQSHAIAVYDAGGHPVALLRMDGNQPGVTEFAVRKAEAVASWHTACGEAGVQAAGFSISRKPKG